MSEIELTQNRLELYKSNLNTHERYLSFFIKKHQYLIAALIPVTLFVLWKTKATKHVFNALTKAGQLGLMMAKLSLLK